MKTTRRPSLNDMRAFEAVARLGSMRAAADALALTHGAVSRRVAKLSDDLGLELFEPAGRGLRLTAEGQALASAMGRALALINDTIDSLRDRDAKRPVVLSCERSVAMRWLIPRLSAFQDRHPEIELHLSVGGGPLDFSRDQVSLALRRLDFPVNPDWRVTPLMRESMGPVMTPALLPGFEAGDYVALASRTRPAAWDDWLGRQPGRARARHALPGPPFPDRRSRRRRPGRGALSAHPGVGRPAQRPVGRAAGLHARRLGYGLIEPKTVPPGAAPALTALKDWLTGAAREADA